MPTKVLLALAASEAGAIGGRCQAELGAFDNRDCESGQLIGRAGGRSPLSSAINALYFVGSGRFQAKIIADPVVHQTKEADAFPPG